MFLPSAEWLNVTRETVVERRDVRDARPPPRDRRLARGRARRPRTCCFPPSRADGKVATKSVEVLSRRRSRRRATRTASLVKAMETIGKDVEHGDELDDETLEEIKEKGIGTPATRAAIVKDLIDKRLARREGRSILPSPLGCSLVRLVRNLSLDALAKAETTGEWEYRLALMTRGDYTREQFSDEMRRYVEEIVNAVRLARRRQRGDLRPRPRPRRPDHVPAVPARQLAEKTFSYMCAKCELEHLEGPEREVPLPRDAPPPAPREAHRADDGLRAHARRSGFLKLNDAFEVEVELAPSPGPDGAERRRRRRRQALRNRARGRGHGQVPEVPRARGRLRRRALRHGLQVPEERRPREGRRSATSGSRRGSATGSFRPTRSAS